MIMNLNHYPDDLLWMPKEAEVLLESEELVDWLNDQAVIFDEIKQHVADVTKPALERMIPTSNGMRLLLFAEPNIDDETYMADGLLVTTTGAVHLFHFEHFTGENHPEGMEKPLLVEDWVRTNRISNIGLGWSNTDYTLCAMLPQHRAALADIWRELLGLWNKDGTIPQYERISRLPNLNLFLGLDKQGWADLINSTKRYGSNR